MKFEEINLKFKNNKLFFVQESTKLKKMLVNDIYGLYECVFPGDEQLGIHSLKANVVLPG
jgi:hypothetical protein